MSKRSWIILCIVLLVFAGGWSLHIRIVLEDLPFLVIGFIGGWYFRSRWKP